MLQDVAYNATAKKSLNPNQLPVPSYLQRPAIKTSFVLLILAFAGITQISAEQRTDKILIQGNSAGTQTVRTDSAGVTHVEYSYNDRGRGDHITATWKLDAAGVPTAYEGSGNDYMKAPIEERFDGMVKRTGKIAANRVSNPSRVKASMSRLMRRQNSPA